MISCLIDTTRLTGSWLYLLFPAVGVCCYHDGTSNNLTHTNPHQGYGGGKQNCWPKSRSRHG